MLKQIALSLLLIGAAAGLWLGREALLSHFGSEALSAPGRTARGGEGVPVIVKAVQEARDDLLVEVVGTGRAQRSITLRPEAAGKVVEMALASGRWFAKGDILLQLDDKDQRLALELAQSRLAEAERIRARYARLQSTGVAADARLDEVATAARIAAIELDQAREELADRSLVAPFDGVSGLPSAEVGDFIDSDDTITTFDDRRILLVEFELPEALQARVANGMAVTASTPAYGDRSFTGSVSAIDSRVDAQTRATRIRVAIPNEDDLLRPGASFSIRLALRGDPYPLVPELAVQFSGGTLHVWRVSEGKAEKVTVELVRRRAGEVLVKGPLREGDLVIVEGTQRLSPGKALRVIDAIAPGES